MTYFRKQDWEKTTTDKENDNVSQKNKISKNAVLSEQQDLMSNDNVSYCNYKKDLEKRQSPLRTRTVVKNDNLLGK